ncbi:unnamed protein product, partial [Amoebophrya sp. A25]
TSGGAPSAITISEELQEVEEEVEDGDMRVELPDPGAESRAFLERQRPGQIRETAHQPGTETRRGQDHEPARETQQGHQPGRDTAHDQPVRRGTQQHQPGRGTTATVSQSYPARTGLTQAEKKVKRARRHFLAVREIFVRVLGYYAQVAGEKWQIISHMKVPTKDDVMERKRSLAGSFQLADLVKNTDEHLGVTAVQVAQEASNTRPVASAPGGTGPSEPGGTEPSAPGGTEPGEPGESEPGAPGQESEPSTRKTLQDMLIVRPESIFKHDKITLLPDNEET